MPKRLTALTNKRAFRKSNSKKVIHFAFKKSDIHNSFLISEEFKRHGITVIGFGGTLLDIWTMIKTTMPVYGERYWVIDSFDEERTYAGHELPQTVRELKKKQ